MDYNRFQKDSAGLILTDHTPKGFQTISPKNDRYATLSWGTFDEVHEPKRFEQYGRTVFDTKTKHICEFKDENTLYNDYDIDPVISAWQIDPLAAKFPHMSPYAAFADNPIFYVDNNGQKIKASNDLGLDAINAVFDYFQQFSTSSEKFKKEDVVNLFELNFDKKSKTYFSSTDKLSFRKFKKNASKHFNFSKKELKSAYKVYLKVQSDKTIEVEAWQKQTPSSTTESGQEGSKVVSKIPGYSRLTTNPSMNQAKNDLKTDNPNTIDRLFDPNNPTYNVDDRGKDWVKFNSTNKQTKGIYIIKASEKMGETLKDALTK